MSYLITLRPKRQITLPQEIVKAIGAQIGEQFVVRVKGKSIILKPSKEGVISTLIALQQVLKKATTFPSLQKEAKQIRRKIWKTRFEQ